MEKQISKFNISSDVVKGNSKQLIICPECNYYNSTFTTYKLTYQKIKTVVCPKCNAIIQIGDIFNFTTGSKLHNRNKRFNQKIIDNYIWNDKYDEI